MPSKSSTSLCFAADAKEKAVKQEMEKLQGTWKVLKSIKEGKAASDDDLKDKQVVIAGDKLTGKGGKRDETASFTIDPEKKPATIDLTFEKAKPTIQGIYELDKDTLKICVSLGKDKRPSEFKSTGNSGTSLLVLEREKK